MIEIGSADAATDWTEVLDLLHRAFAVMEGRIDPPSSLHDMDEMTLAEIAARQMCLLADEDGELIGCLFGDPQDEGLMISKMAVDPDRQGEGIGRALMDLAEAEARAGELPALRLQTRVELTENHIVFAAMGFAEIGHTTHPGFEHPTSITMEKRL
ncbi:MAG: GNAT family N-acetyltransferase [Paracoccaceae bacterium]